GGYATPADAIVPEGVEFSVKTGVWPYDVAKAKALMAEAGYPNGFETELWSAYNHTIAQKVTQVLQQQLQQIGIKTPITLLEAGRTPRRRRCGSTTSAGRPRPAKPTGRSAPCSTASRGRRSFSTRPTTRASASTAISKTPSSPPTTRKRRSSTRTRRTRSTRMP